MASEPPLDIEPPERGSLRTGPLRSALDRVATAPRLLVALDFDGVLAPIVSNPAAVVANPTSMGVLGRLAELTDTEVALVSGRPLAFLQSLPNLAEGVWLAGGHGADFGHRSVTELAESDRVLLANITADLDTLARRHPGALVEAKRCSVAFHYRNLEPALGRELRAVITEGPGALPGVQIKPGKMVVELAVSRATKGTAVAALRVDAAVDTVIFIGDDVTDEDAFAALTDNDLAIKVGPGETRAPHRIGDTDDVAELLTLLLSLRRKNTTPPG